MLFARPMIASTLTRSPSDETSSEERMITMVDELYDRQYRDGRHELNAFLVRSLSSLGTAMKDVFEVLVGIEYQAPWASRSRQARCE